MEDNPLVWNLVLWMLSIGAIAAVRSKKTQFSVSFMLAYLLNLWIIHWPAVLLYLQPGFRFHDPRLVVLGFEQSTWAVMAFAMGSIVLAPLILDLGVFPPVKARFEADRRLPMAYILFGVLFALLFRTALGRLPSMAAIVSTGQSLVVVGLGLSCRQAWKEGNFPRMAAMLCGTFALPVVTILTQGFIGYGALAALSVLVFLSSFVERRVLVLVAGVVLGYLGLSVYVTYMRDRGEIREVVWGGQSLRDRIERVTETVQDFEWFDPVRQEHQYRVDSRLNQNHLVGAAVSRLTSTGGYANGSTMWEALLALIPRALWPDKPVRAGSGNVVSEYTGIQFAVGTSVGIGHVLEFYINFGTVGVLIGFVLMGALITIIDKMAADHLVSEDLPGFVMWYLPGLSFLHVGGSFVEMTASAGASLAVAFAANKYLERLARTKGPARRMNPAPGFAHAGRGFTG